MLDSTKSRPAEAAETASNADEHASKYVIMAGTKISTERHTPSNRGLLPATEQAARAQAGEERGAGLVAIPAPLESGRTAAGVAQGFEQHHAVACFSERERCAEAAEARPDHHHIGVFSGLAA